MIVREFIGTCAYGYEWIKIVDDSDKTIFDGQVQKIWNLNIVEIEKLQYILNSDIQKIFTEDHKIVLQVGIKVKTFEQLLKEIECNI